MAVKKDYESWQTGLRQGSDELEDLDIFAEEHGFTRQEATRQILIMWSKARRGKLTQTYGFFSPSTYPVGPVPAAPTTATPENAKQVKRSKGNGNIAAKGLDLD